MSSLQNQPQAQANDGPARLILATLRDDGVHTSRQLSDYAQSGRALRLRRGVYISRRRWQEAPPWTRYRIATAATALAPSPPVFCHETALMLHGLPLLNLPPAVLVRSSGPWTDGTRRVPALTDTWPNIPTKLVEAALPSGKTRPQMRAEIADGSTEPPWMTLPASALSSVEGPEIYRVEPMELVLVDTVSRMPFPDAVVVLDAVKRQGKVNIQPWRAYLRSARRSAFWDRVWDFADARSESVLESESRAVLHSLGFPAPDLQTEVLTHLGTFRLDMCWPGARIAGEVDGRVKYADEALRLGRSAEEVHFQEKLRREAIEELGWRVVRWGKAELREPERLRRRLLRAGLSLK